MNDLERLRLTFPPPWQYLPLFWENRRRTIVRAAQ
jgi:hypothetical protein